MAHPSRPLTSSLRHPSIGDLQNSTGPSPLLQSRITEKKAELENLKQLRDLSGGLAAQMEALEQKLSTLSNGTEAVATVLSNWHNVMRAINMASAKLPSASNEPAAAAIDPEASSRLPQTLVRIPASELDRTSHTLADEDAAPDTT